MKKIEILAPVGNFSCLRAAADAKADAIYFGVGNLNMRSHSTANFSISDLKEISIYCEEHNITPNLTLNTLIYDNDLPKIKEILHAAKESGINNIIASDFAVIDYANKIDLNIHISTQANVSNIEAVRFFSKYADVIVLARELNLNQITEICSIIEKENITGPNKKLIKIEIFVHGALCIGISGKCYMSLAQYNKSANRGECFQACRRKYRVIEEETNKELIIDNKYIMSPKDLCTITCLDQIIKSGVSILKIEGRARSAEYVKTVTTTYKEAVQTIENDSYTKDKIEKWLTDLKSVFNRGFWHGGYYLGNDLDMWCKSYGSSATEKKIYIGIATNYFSKIKVAEFLIHTKELKIGDEIFIIGHTTGLIKSKITKLKTTKDVEVAKKGDKVSFYITDKIRKNDKLYLIEKKL
jgi:putative protease